MNKRYIDKGKVGALHFCTYRDSRMNKPLVTVSTDPILAYRELAEKFELYQIAMR